MTEASLTARIDQDIIAAMKARDAERTTALRMVKTALKNKEIEKRQPL
ncbi:MAG TPA: GatB/YqeY domain-containing protein, partial [Acidobacteriaceae bacterium]|nr:GatB/YqeY domain-containing protein [Acidobacteriaceae bacterium]